jgi:DNA repair photolyase
MGFKSWDKVEIKTEHGVFKGIAPIIISASRSTDIPAFHAEWFFNRLAAGYTKWINPFNHVPQYVSFSKTRVIVFWTKNAKPIIQHLSKLDRNNINYYFTFTVNDYEAEKLEPNLPPLQKRIEIFQELATRIGRDKVIWRFDPLILTKDITIHHLINKIQVIGSQLKNYTNKLVISFADIEKYSKVKRNLQRSNITYREFSPDDIELFSDKLNQLNQYLELDIATCGENANLERFGIHHNKCIDDKLMIKLFSNDKILMDFLGAHSQSIDLFSFPEQPLKDTKHKLKDNGQRQNCGCIVSKDIGQYNTCIHLCKYCYANFSENAVKKNCKNSNRKNAETIAPSRFAQKKEKSTSLSN